MWLCHKFVLCSSFVHMALCAQFETKTGKSYDDKAFSFQFGLLNSDAVFHVLFSFSLMTLAVCQCCKKNKATITDSAPVGGEAAGAGGAAPGAGGAAPGAGGAAEGEANNQAQPDPTAAGIGTQELFSPGTQTAAPQTAGLYTAGIGTKDMFNDMEKDNASVSQLPADAASQTAGCGSMSAVTQTQMTQTQMTINQTQNQTQTQS